MRVGVVQIVPKHVVRLI